MTISKKASRSIAVNEQQFHWAVSEDSGYSNLIVQGANGHGQKLEVQFSWTSTTDGHIIQIPITPAVVVDAIKFGFENGWKPDARGAAYHCRFVPDNGFVAFHR
jgi:hypothetical protein